MLRYLLLAVTLSCSSMVFAQSRCDCDEVVGQCRATITEVPTKSPGARFKLQANTQQCSIVEWSVDGDHGMTTIWDDGEEVSRVSPRKPGGTLKVHSCRVCKDRLAGMKGVDQPAGPVSGSASQQQQGMSDSAKQVCTAYAEAEVSCGKPASARINCNNPRVLAQLENTTAEQIRSKTLEIASKSLARADQLATDASTSPQVEKSMRESAALYACIGEHLQ